MTRYGANLLARLWLGLATGLLIVFLVYSLRHFGGELGHEVIGRWLNAAIGVTPGAYCLGRALTRKQERPAWLLLGIGSTAWGLGGVYYLAAYWNAKSVPFPSPADVGYLAVYPFAYAGLLLLLKRRLTGFRNTLWLDGLIGGLAVSAFATAVVFQQVQSSVGGSPAAVATNLAYPLGDALLIALVVLVFGMSGWRPGRAWLLLGLGFLLFFAGDSVYLVQTAQGTYSPGHLLDASWPAGLLLIAWAAAKPSPAQRIIRADGWIVLAAPALFVTAVIGLETWDHYHPLNTLSLVLMTMTLVVAVARLALTFAENMGMLRHSRTEALTDPLTRLGNRRRLFADLDSAFADPGQRRLLVLLDLNGFKHYNDTFGHLAGDALLARLGNRLNAAADGRGHAYRLGGDEFCALLDLGDSAVEPVVGEVATALSERGDGFVVEASFGALTLPGGATSAIDALRIVDHRMYAQKHAGRLSAQEQSSSVLFQAFAERHPQFSSHMERVSDLSSRVAARLGLDLEEVRQIRVAAGLHDIGKVAIPDAILDRPGTLTEQELAFVQTHTLIGERIMLAAPALGPASRIVRSSHERIDGTGYPDGLAGDRIPIGSRIIFACDAYDAMLSTRPYAAARPSAEALDELRACSGTQFDPAVVAALGAELEARPAAELAA
jgi:two-component system cell cycle response regulator